MNRRQRRGSGSGQATDAGLKRICTRVASGALLCCITSAFAAAPAEGDATIGYDSVAAAKSALTATRGATVQERNGWTHVLLDEGRQRWTFVPRGHRAWPAAVRRDVVQRGQRPTLETRLLCEAARPACDALFERLRTADEALSRELGIMPPP